MENTAIIAAMEPERRAVATPSPIGANIVDDFIRFADVKPASVRSYRQGLNSFFSYLQAEGTTTPSRNDILNWRDGLSKAGRAASTVHLYLVAVRLFFSWAEVAGIYPNIAKNVKSPKTSTNHKKDYLLPEQVKAILKNIDTGTEQGLRDKAIISLMVTGGARDIEIARADIGDIQTSGGDLVLYVHGKDRDDKADFIRIVPQVAEFIRNYLAKRGEKNPQAPLFASLDHRNKGGRMSTRSISRIGKSRMEKAGIISDRLTAHSFRHTAVTLAIQGHMSLQDTQQFARHKNVATTMIYYHEQSLHENRCAEAVAEKIF